MYVSMLKYLHWNEFSSETPRCKMQLVLHVLLYIVCQYVTLNVPNGKTHLNME